MLSPRISLFSLVFLSLLALIAAPVFAQSGGNSTSVTGTVLDPSRAVVAGATVEIHNPVSQFQRSTNTDSQGNFSIPNVPFNQYHLNVSAPGFAAYSQDVDVRS